jgi:hypothetical protein
MSQIRFDVYLSTNHTRLWPLPYVSRLAEMLMETRASSATLYLWRLCSLRAGGRL